MRAGTLPCLLVTLVAQIKGTMAAHTFIEQEDASERERKANEGKFPVVGRAELSKPYDSSHRVAM